MKILHINFSFTQGGIDNMMNDIMFQQDKMGHNVSLLIVNDNRSSEVLDNVPSGIRLYCLQRPAGSKNPFYIVKLYWYVSYIVNPDVIHCHNSKLGPLLKFTALPKILTVHDIGYKTNHYKYFDHIVCISEAVKEDVLNRGFSSTKMSVIFNGINFALLKKERTAKTLDDIFKVILVSRLVWYKKGHDLLLESLQIILEKYMFRNIKVYFLGDGESRNYLEELVKELNLQNKVTFLGSKNRKWVYEHLCDYDLLVQPSRFEGFGLTIVEGFAANTAVLASNIDGPIEILENGKYGFLFKSEDIEDLARQIVNIASMDKKELKRKIAADRSAFEQIYSIEKTTKSYISLYESLL